mgnify:CR=1 FL=1
MNMRKPVNCPICGRFMGKHILIDNWRQCSKCKIIVYFRREKCLNGMVV